MSGVKLEEIDLSYFIFIDGFSPCSRTNTLELSNGIVDSGMYYVVAAV